LYVIDLAHYLDPKGAIAPERGPARKFADFVTAVVAHATDFDRPDDTPGPLCFRCRTRDQRFVAPRRALPKTTSSSGDAWRAAPKVRSPTGRGRSGI
jgi:hypothetical protein